MLRWCVVASCSNELHLNLNLGFPQRHGINERWFTNTRALDNRGAGFFAVRGVEVTADRVVALDSVYLTGMLLLVTFGTWHRRHLVERPGESEERRPLGPPPLEVVR